MRTTACSRIGAEYAHEYRSLDHSHCSNRTRAPRMHHDETEQRGPATALPLRWTLEVAGEIDGRCSMGAIVPFLKGAAFDPQDIQSMSLALDDICKALKIDGDASARQIIAVRIIELATRGERSATGLRDRLLAEANSGTG